MYNINYDYYRIFYYVAKYGNISQAAKMLMNNQPNLTRSIKNLEGELGCTLFVRSNRGMKLTPEGEKLYSHIRIALEHIEAGEEEISRSKNLEGGAIYVSASEVALNCCILPIFKKYRTLYPKVKIRISNHSTPQAITALKEGLADLAIVTTPTVKSTTLTEKKIKTIREVAVCGNGFPELLGRKVSLQELAEYPVISLGTDTKTFEMYSAFFTKNGLKFLPDIEAATADQILPMVRSDLGIGFVPEEFLENTDDVARIDLAEKIPLRSVCVIKRKEQPLSVAAKELEKLILDSRTETAEIGEV